MDDVFQNVAALCTVILLNATQAKNDEVIYANEISKESKEMAERAEKIADGAKKGI